MRKTGGYIKESGTGHHKKYTPAELEADAAVYSKQFRRIYSKNN